jgi:hypothetical protein
VEVNVGISLPSSLQVKCNKKGVCGGGGGGLLGGEIKSSGSEVKLSHELKAT